MCEFQFVPLLVKALRGVGDGDCHGAAALVDSILHRHHCRTECLQNHVSRRARYCVGKQLVLQGQYAWFFRAPYMWHNSLQACRNALMLGLPSSLTQSCTAPHPCRNSSTTYSAALSQPGHETLGRPFPWCARLHAWIKLSGSATFVMPRITTGLQELSHVRFGCIVSLCLFGRR